MLVDSRNIYGLNICCSKIDYESKYFCFIWFGANIYRTYIATYNKELYTLINQWVDEEMPSYVLIDYLLEMNINQFKYEGTERLVPSEKWEEFQKELHKLCLTAQQ